MNTRSLDVNQDSLSEVIDLINQRTKNGAYLVHTSMVSDETISQLTSKVPTFYQAPALLVIPNEGYLKIEIPSVVGDHTRNKFWNFYVAPSETDAEKLHTVLVEDRDALIMVSLHRGVITNLFIMPRCRPAPPYQEEVLGE